MRLVSRKPCHSVGFFGAMLSHHHRPHLPNYPINMAKNYTAYRYRDIQHYRVIDGDTINMQIALDSLCREESAIAFSDLGFGAVNAAYGTTHVSQLWGCRLCDIDTPEKHTEAGKYVAGFTKRWLELNHWQVVYIKFDKYRTRFIGYPVLSKSPVSAHCKTAVFDQPDGSLSRKLWELGMAKRYSGRVAKEPWTDKQLDIAKSSAVSAIAELHESVLLENSGWRSLSSW